MNFRIIAYIVGWVCNFQAIFMVLPCITALVYQEHEFFAFLISMILCLIVGIPLTARKPKNKVFYTKDGCVAVALSWLALCIFGSVPFVLSNSIPHPIDAFFETVSGFTTTGSSILTDVEVLPHCILMWRSFTHWIGGMGVLVFVMMITSIPLFVTLCIAFGTAGTGGFGIKNDSMGSYSTYCQIVTTIFMILFGVNFSAYYLILTKKIRQALKFEEVRYYFGIIAVAILVIGLNTMHLFQNLGVSIQQAAFQVGSIITTTGFSSADFNQWPALSKTILVLLMFVGACAGSTGGGIKVSRILILCKAAKKEFQLYLHPNAVKKIKMDQKTITHDILRSTNIYLTLYLLIFAVSILLISLDNFDMTTNFTAVTATLNNIGPGLEIVGPMGNFSSFSYFSKCVLIFDMLAGRLEIFPLLLLFFKGTWKKF